MRCRRVGVIGGLLAVAGCVGAVAYVFRPTTAPPPDWSADYDVTSRPPEAMAPGTVVGTTAPAGWSHLVIKGVPRVHPDHRSKLNAITIAKASWLVTAFAADVRPEHAAGRTRYRLRAVGLGLGSRNADGQDVMVTPETAERFGVKLDFITRQILERAHATQRRAVMVVHGPSLGLLDTPVWALWNGKHELVRYRYALLVDADTGRLDTFMWVLGPDGGLGDSPVVGWLKPDTIDEAELIPDLEQIPAGLMPKSDGAFAVEKRPPARARFPLAADLQGLAARTRFTPADAYALEAALRRFIAG